MVNERGFSNHLLSLAGTFTISKVLVANINQVDKAYKRLVTLKKHPLERRAKEGESPVDVWLRR